MANSEARTVPSYAYNVYRKQFWMCELQFVSLSQLFFLSLSQPSAMALLTTKNRAHVYKTLCT